eukprot:SAG31_NODE_2291_length_5998_cov_175.153077_1_plen_1117_part_00
MAALDSASASCAPLGASPEPPAGAAKSKNKSQSPIFDPLSSPPLLPSLAGMMTDAQCLGVPDEVIELERRAAELELVVQAERSAAAETRAGLQMEREELLETERQLQRIEDTMRHRWATLCEGHREEEQEERRSDAAPPEAPRADEVEAEATNQLLLLSEKAEGPTSVHGEQQVDLAARKNSRPESAPKAKCRRRKRSQVRQQQQQQQQQQQRRRRQQHGRVRSGQAETSGAAVAADADSVRVPVFVSTDAVSDSSGSDEHDERGCQDKDAELERDMLAMYHQQEDDFSTGGVTEAEEEGFTVQDVPEELEEDHFVSLLAYEGLYSVVEDAGEEDESSASQSRNEVQHEEEHSGTLESNLKGSDKVLQQKMHEHQEWSGELDALHQRLLLQQDCLQEKQSRRKSQRKESRDRRQGATSGTRSTAVVTDIVPTSSQTAAERELVEAKHKIASLEKQLAAAAVRGQQSIDSSDSDAALATRTPPKAPEGGHLVAFTVCEDGWICSACDADVVAGDRLYGNRDEDFDLCWTCYHKACEGGAMESAVHKPNDQQDTQQQAVRSANLKAWDDSVALLRHPKPGRDRSQIGFSPVFSTRSCSNTLHNDTENREQRRTAKPKKSQTHRLQAKKLPATVPERCERLGCARQTERRLAMIEAKSATLVQQPEDGRLVSLIGRPTYELPAEYKPNPCTGIATEPQARRGRKCHEKTSRGRSRSKQLQQTLGAKKEKKKEKDKEKQNGLQVMLHEVVLPSDGGKHVADECQECIDVVQLDAVDADAAARKLSAAVSLDDPEAMSEELEQIVRLQAAVEAQEKHEQQRLLENLAFLDQHHSFDVDDDNRSTQQTAVQGLDSNNERAEFAVVAGGNHQSEAEKAEHLLGPQETDICETVTDGPISRSTQAAPLQPIAGLPQGFADMPAHPRSVCDKGLCAAMEHRKSSSITMPSNRMHIEASSFFLSEEENIAPFTDRQRRWLDHAQNIDKAELRENCVGSKSSICSDIDTRSSNAIRSAVSLCDSGRSFRSAGAKPVSTSSASRNVRKSSSTCRHHVKNSSGSNSRSLRDRQVAAGGFNDMAANAKKRLPIENKYDVQRQALHELLEDTAQVVSFSHRLRKIGSIGQC